MESFCDCVLPFFPEPLSLLPKRLPGVRGVTHDQAVNQLQRNGALRVGKNCLYSESPPSLSATPKSLSPRPAKAGEDSDSYEDLPTFDATIKFDPIEKCEDRKPAVFRILEFCFVFG
jgi:hypothetical protein